MEDLEPEFLEQVKNMSQSKDWQTAFETWKPSSGRIDWFDVVKMSVCAKEILGMPTLYPKAKWPNGVWPKFVERRIKLTLERLQPRI
jgi:hypothetical protein